MYLGIAARKHDGSIDIGFCAHDGTYSTDFAVHTIEAGDDPAFALSNYIVPQVRRYQEEHEYKFVGVGIGTDLLQLSPGLSSRIWRDLDIVPLVFGWDKGIPSVVDTQGMEVDELADYMARRCIL